MLILARRKSATTTRLSKQSCGVEVIFGYRFRFAHNKCTRVAAEGNVYYFDAKLNPLRASEAAV